MPKFNIVLTNEVDSRLNEIAKKKGITKAETMKKAFALLFVAYEQKTKGNTLGIVNEDHNTRELKAIGKIIGI